MVSKRFEERVYGISGPVRQVINSHDLRFYEQARDELGLKITLSDISDRYPYGELDEGRMYLEGIRGEGVTDLGQYHRRVEELKIEAAKQKAAE